LIVCEEPAVADASSHPDAGFDFDHLFERAPFFKLDDCF
jgi:hypothetical protein